MTIGSGYDSRIESNPADPDTVGSLIEHLHRLEAHQAKWEAEGDSLRQSVVEAKQRISRAVKVLNEALGDYAEVAPR